MSEPTMSWADLLAWSDGHGLLGKRLYVVLSDPVTGLQAVLDNLDAHVAYQTRLENEEADPMHACGARRFTVRPWLLNEGTFSVRLFYSGGKPRIE